MPSPDLHFPNAPIVEAIFHIEAAAQIAVSSEEFVKQARELVSSETFPQMGEMLEFGVQLETDLATGETRSNNESSWRGVEFRSEERSQVIQFRSNGMSFHQLQPYTSHEEILPQFQKYWSAYAGIAGIRSSIRQSLRFVNRIQLPVGTSIDKIGEFAKISPSFALVDELEPQNLLSRVQLRDPATGIQALVAFALADPGKLPLELIFDIDVAMSRSLEPSDPELWSGFAQLRDLKNRIFCGSLHQKCLDLFT